MKIFISQPMNGKETETIKTEREEFLVKFKEENPELADAEIVDSIFGDYPTADVNIKNFPLNYLAKSISLMSTVDGIIFMPGWENARGCKAEHDLAVAYGVDIISE